MSDKDIKASRFVLDNGEVVIGSELPPELAPYMGIEQNDFSKSVLSNDEYDTLKRTNFDNLKRFLWGNDLVKRVVKTFPNEKQAEVFKSIIENFTAQRNQTFNYLFSKNKNIRQADHLARKLDLDDPANAAVREEAIKLRALGVKQTYNSLNLRSWYRTQDIIKASDPSSLVKNLRQSTYNVRQFNVNRVHGNKFDLTEKEQTKMLQEARAEKERASMTPEQYDEYQRYKKDKAEIFSDDDFLHMREDHVPFLGNLAASPSDELVGPRVGTPIDIDMPAEERYVRSDADATKLGIKPQQMETLDNIVTEMKYIARNQLDLMHSFLFSSDWEGIHAGNAESMDNAASKVLQILNNHDQMIKARSNFVRSSNRYIPRPTTEQSEVFKSRFSIKGQGRGTNFSIEIGSMAPEPMENMAKALDDAFMHRLALEATGGSMVEVKDLFKTTSPIGLGQKAKEEKTSLQTARIKMMKEKVSLMAKIRAANITQVFRDHLGRMEDDLRWAYDPESTLKLHDALLTVRDTTPGIASPELAGTPNIIEGMASRPELSPAESSMIRTMRAFGLTDIKPETFREQFENQQTVKPDFHC